MLTVNAAILLAVCALLGSAQAACRTPCMLCFCMHSPLTTMLGIGRAASWSASGGVPPVLLTSDTAPMIVKLPTAWSWSNVNGTSFVGPVRGEATPAFCDSCWVTAPLFALGVRAAIANQLQFSPFYANLVRCCVGAF